MVRSSKPTSGHASKGQDISISDTSALLCSEAFFTVVKMYEQPKCLFHDEWIKECVNVCVCVCSLCVFVCVRVCSCMCVYMFVCAHVCVHVGVIEY